MISSILYIGGAPGLKKLGFDQSFHLDDLFSENNPKYKIVLISSYEMARFLVKDIASNKEPEKTLNFINYFSKAPFYKIVLFDNKKEFDDFKLILEQSPKAFKSLLKNHFYFLQYQNQQELEDVLSIFLEKAKTQEQQNSLFSLWQEQNKNLHNQLTEIRSHKVQLENQLELLLKKNQNNLQKRKLLDQCLEAIYTSGSNAEIERRLFSILNPLLKLHQIRIFVDQEGSILTEPSASLTDLLDYKMNLFLHNKALGQILFLKNQQNGSFNKSEIDFIEKLNEPLALAIYRIQILREMESLNYQWVATFNSVPHPILIINSHYNIIQTNGITEDALYENKSQLREKCYSRLFSRNSPCPSCNLGKKFTVQNRPENINKNFLESNVKARIFEVSSQQVDFKNPEESDELYVNVYYDVTDRAQLEKQIFEKSKLSDLGIISSSIAHELNNPIGGILAYSQLIKMDLPKNHALYDDIMAIEMGAIRCKEIIENLLDYTRASHLETAKVFDLKDALTRAAKIISLTAKTLQIKIVSEIPNESFLVFGLKNQITLVFNYLLQKSLEFLSTNSFKPDGQILIELGEYNNNKDLYNCRIRSVPDKNGAPSLKKVNHPIQKNVISSNQEEFILMQNIVNEHQGQIEHITKGEEQIFNLRIPRVSQVQRAATAVSGSKA